MGRRRFSRAFKRAVAAEYIKSGVKRQESDKRKDTTSSHQFAAKLIKIIDFPIIFSIIKRKIKTL